MIRHNFTKIVQRKHDSSFHAVRVDLEIQRKFRGEEIWMETNTDDDQVSVALQRLHYDQISDVILCLSSTEGPQ